MEEKILIVILHTINRCKHKEVAQQKEWQVDLRKRYNQVSHVMKLNPENSNVKFLDLKQQ